MSSDMSDLARRLTDLRRQSVSRPPSTEVPVWDGDLDTMRSELYELRRRLHARVAQELGTVLYQQNLNPDRLSQLVLDHISRLLREEPTPMSTAERAALLEDLKADVLGHGPIEELLKDPEITEVMVNGPSEIYVERAGKLFRTNRRFVDEDHLRGVIDAIVARVGRRIDEASPMVDARMPDGARVNAVVHPLAINGPFLTIRKFSAEPLTDVDLISFGTLTATVTEFLQLCVRGKLNLIISGGTGAGKTSTLNVLSTYIPSDERTVTVEDAVELRLGQPHVLQLEARPPNIEGRGEVTIRDLVRNALRMRPDRIVVGEVRGGEALDMLQAMNTGHEGSISTLHANSPRDALSRLETMVLMAGMDLPVRAIREQISSAVDLVVHQARLKDGSRRVTHISEIEGMEGNVITLQDIFLFDYSMGIDGHGRHLGHLKPTGIRPKFTGKLSDVGIHMAPTMFMSDDLLSAHQYPGRQ